MTNRLDPETAASCARTLVMDIRRIIEVHGDRPPGSAGERACLLQLQDELHEAGFNTRLEEFSVAPKAFMAMPLVCSLLACCAVIMYWIAPRLSFVPIVLAVVVFVCELILYKHVLTPFFPKRKSANLSAALPPTGQPKRRIILAGHADAAYEWNLHRWFPRIFPVFPILIFLSVVYVFFATTAIAIAGGTPHEPGIWRLIGFSLLLAVPGLVAGILYTNFRRVAPGAADNLSGALCAVRLLNWMKVHGVSFEHTEVVALVTGAEEAGLVGARAYIEEHRHEFESTPTAVIALDTMAELDHLAIHNRDLNARVVHDARVCRLIQDAGRSLGLVLNYASVTVGASDAAAFTQAGIPATALCAMDHAPAHYYHNRRDSWEVLEESCLAQTLQLLLATCEQYEASGLETKDSSSSAT